VLAFENISFQELTKDEQEILLLALDLVQGVLEKKVFFQMSQELSIIDAATDGRSMAFFMAILEREIENSKRNRYPISLFTLTISNFRDITRDMDGNREHGLIRVIQSIILKTMRKSDIVARWETASFAFILTHTPLERARMAQERISQFIRQNLSKYLPASAEIAIEVGVSQYIPEEDQTPDIFFDHARPKTGT